MFFFSDVVLFAHISKVGLDVTARLLSTDRYVSRHSFDCGTSAEVPQVTLWLGLLRASLDHVKQHCSVHLHHRPVRVRGSAIFTASNMVISALTYRRLRPKVKVRFRWEPVGVEEPLAQHVPSDFQNGFHVHVRNVGPTEVHIKSVKVVCRHKFTTLSIPIPVRFKWATSAALVGEDREMKIPAFGGVSWQISRPFNYAQSFKHAAVQVTLTNGRETRSRWHSMKSLKRIDAAYESARRVLDARAIHVDEVAGFLPDEESEEEPYV